jgi:hypothetical protein
MEAEYNERVMQVRALSPPWLSAGKINRLASPAAACVTVTTSTNQQHEMSSILQ